MNGTLETELSYYKRASEMSIGLNVEWLRKQAVDEESRRWISKIKKWRDFVLENNRFIKSQHLFSVNLGKYQIWFRKCSAFSSIEVYQEIFKENDHFAVSEFSGKNAELVIDIGANEGFYTLKIKENNPECKIIAVEPNPYVFEVLKKNVDSNQLKNVTLVNMAISSSVGVMNMEIIREIGAIGAKDLGIIERPWLRDKFIEKVVVDAITFDILCKKFYISSIDILKIDVEGMEVEILTSIDGLLKNVHKIVLERHSKELREAVVTLLKNYHFTLVHEEDPLLERYYGDLYFVNKAFE